MKTALLAIVGIIAAAVVTYVLLFPRDKSVHFISSDGGAIAFSPKGISFHAAPDHFEINGFEHIEGYISRFLVPSNRFKLLRIFTPDGKRGLGLIAKDGMNHASLSVEWRQDSQRETSIRAFFDSLGIAPSQDYLAGNGGVPDAIRILEYPVSGSPEDVTALTKRVLRELCTVTPTEALDIGFEEK